MVRHSLAFLDVVRTKLLSSVHAIFIRRLGQGRS